MPSRITSSRTRERRADSRSSKLARGVVYRNDVRGTSADCQSLSLRWSKDRCEAAEGCEASEGRGTVRRTVDEGPQKQGLSWSWELDFDALLAALSEPAPWNRQDPRASVPAQAQAPEAASAADPAVDP